MSSFPRATKKVEETTTCLLRIIIPLQPTFTTKQEVLFVSALTGLFLTILINSIIPPLLLFGWYSPRMSVLMLVGDVLLTFSEIFLLLCFSRQMKESREKTYQRNPWRPGPLTDLPTQPITAVRERYTEQIPVLSSQPTPVPSHERYYA